LSANAGSISKEDLEILGWTPAQVELHSADARCRGIYRRMGEAAVLEAESFPVRTIGVLIARRRAAAAGRGVPGPHRRAHPHWPLVRRSRASRTRRPAGGAACAAMSERAVRS
jgi:hypothetical protein